MKLGTWMVVFVLLLAVMAGGSALWGRYLAEVGPLQQPVKVMIEQGMGTRSVAERLAKNNVITEPTAFVAAVRVMNLDSTLKAGEYGFDPGISLRAVINKIAMGDTENRSVTIPEGWTVKEAIARLDGMEGLTGKSSRPEEGMIFPDTYQFRFGTDRAKLMETMQKRMEAEMQKAWAARNTSIPLKSPGELLILASIVQKEAANDEEMPRIAGVFINRLNKGMRLQSDPTVIYGAEAYGGDIRRKDLQDEQPFNTYIYAGLPPTPISNPGLAALMAVAQPVLEDDLYFVADPSRQGHVFSKTYAEHEKGVKSYWKNVGKFVSASAVISATKVVSVTQPTKVK